MSSPPSPKPNAQEFDHNNYPAHTAVKRARRASITKPKYSNHETLIQTHLDAIKHQKVAGKPQDILHMYEMIEKIAKDKQELILAEIKAHDASFRGGSKRKTRRNRG
jgi:hypothetical protein